MKKHTLVFVLLTGIAFMAPSMFAAQTSPPRPECGAHPGSCFINLRGGLCIVSFNEAGDLVAGCPGDSADDWITIRPDGTPWIHMQDRQSQVFYCPATSYPGCLDDDMGNPGLLTGTGRTTVNSDIDIWCPYVAGIDAIVATSAGARFNVDYSEVWRPDGHGGCKEIFLKLKVTPVN